MNVYVFVNDATDVGPRQTTAMLIASLMNHGCQVMVAGVDGFEIRDADHPCWISSTPMTPGTGSSSPWTSETVALHCAQSQASPQPNACQSGDLILIRTNPGRDSDRSAIHQSCLHFCELAQQFGIRVVNAPAQLERFASKASLALLPESLRPAMTVSSRPATIAQFVVDSRRPCVIKPLIGSRGESVIRVTPDDDVIEVAQKQFNGQPMVAQHFIDTSEPGDKRVLVLNGQILEDPGSGTPAGIQRIPAPGDFRANLHAGGKAVPLVLSQRERAVVTEAASLLNQQGIWLAGIDLVAAQIIEFNVFSTGGLYYAQQFSGHDYAGQIVDQLLHKFA